MNKPSSDKIVIASDPPEAEAISLFSWRLPRTFQVLAMTDISSN
ncbi:MAG: hypothetical protein AB1390_10520 [Nitrospirota bacterium]